MNQNLSSYLDFLYGCQCRNISKAAKELYISQPAISKSIQKLEENLGCKLFSRSSRGVVLTDEGQLLYGHVKEAFETLTLGEDKLKRSIDLGVGHLQIGVAPVALGLGDNGGHRGAVLAGDGAGQLGLVQRVIQGLAHLTSSKGGFVVLTVR